MHIVDHLRFTPDNGEIRASKKYNGAPEVTGIISARLADREAGVFRDALHDHQNGGAEYAPPVFTGKSGSTHGGLHVDPDWTAARIEGNEHIVIPANVVSLRPENWLRGYLQAMTGDTRMSVGRALCYRHDEVLTADELQREIASERSIRFPQPFELTDDMGRGVLRAPLNPGEEFVLDAFSLTDAHIRDIIRHGRTSLEVIQYLRTRDTRTAVPPGRTHTGTLGFSTIEHPLLIRPDLGDASVEFLSAPYYDPMRSTGRGPGTYGRRPVSMINNTDVPVRTESVSVPLVALRPPAGRIPRSVGLRSETASNRIHEDGMKFTDVVPVNPVDLHRWFAGITSHPDDGGQSAMIVSRNGATPVPWAATYPLYKKRINDAVEDVRTADPDFEKICRSIPLTSATGRTFIGHHLPSSSHLEALSRDGIKVFMFRGMAMDKQVFDDRPDSRPLNNFYMTNTVHQKLMELERQGCQFIWWPVSASGDERPREFYKGLFVLPEEKDRYDRFRNGGTGIAMFGSGIPGMENAVRGDISRFGEGLKKDLSSFGEIGILEGGGPGLMQAARDMAKEQDFFNISFGVDFEKIDETPNFDSQAVVHFATDQIEYRQTLFEMMQLIPVFNIGGKGTWYEQVLSFLNQGLERYVPTPLICINKDGFWEGTMAQIAAMTDTTRFVKPPTKPWQRHMVSAVDTYEEARRIITSFVNDPAKSWAAAGITPVHIRDSLRRHESTARDMHLTIPQYLLEASERYGRL